MNRIAKATLATIAAVSMGVAVGAVAAHADGRSTGTQVDMIYNDCPTGTHPTWSADRDDNSRCVADPEEDEPGWKCWSMGNHLCGDQSGRSYPVHIEGHYLTGWHIWRNDGTEQTLPPWYKIKGECAHDDNPDACLTAWHIIYSNKGEERAMIRGLTR